MALGIFAALLPSLAPADVKVGDDFPFLIPANLGGAVVPPTAGKVALIDFWASWCGPCKSSFPAYNRIQMDYAAEGLVIIAVSIDKKAADYASFIHKRKPIFVTVLDEGHGIVAAVSPPTMPTSYLLGRDGKVRYIHIGFRGAETERMIRAEITGLLAEPTLP